MFTKFYALSLINYFESSINHSKQKNYRYNIIKTSFSVWVVFPILLLLVIVFIDHFFIRPIFSELDILEHFLFGFIISEVVGRVAGSLDYKKWLIKRKQCILKSNLFIRLIAFLIIGGLLWESLEYFVFPALGTTYNPFFAFPITLHNIDGTIDVTVGILGCISAWYTQKVMGDARVRA